MESKIPSEKTLYELSQLYKMFADPTRVKILCVLSEGELCVQELSDKVGMAQSAVSHQLRTLKQMYLVKNRREGKTIFYSLADAHIEMILSMGLEHVNE